MPVLSPSRYLIILSIQDLILLMLDATKDDRQIEILENELHTVGIRLNQKPPDIYFKPKKAGGLAFNSTVPLTHLDERLCRYLKLKRSLQTL